MPGEEQVGAKTQSGSWGANPALMPTTDLDLWSSERYLR